MWFRDWLRAEAGARRRYEALKRRLAADNVGKPDFDDYTRAKTAFFDDVLPEFTAWAQRNCRPVVGRGLRASGPGRSAASAI